MASYKTPPANRANSTSGLTQKLNALADALLQLPWLSKTFAQAITDQSNEGNLYPISFENTTGTTPLNSYTDLSPSKMLSDDAYSFFRLRDPITFLDQSFGRNATEIESPVSLIVWADLSRVNNTAGYLLTNDLIEDVINIFSLQGGVELEQVFLEPPSVWDGYKFSDNDYQLVNKSPYVSFRIDLSIRVSVKCR